MSNNEAAVCDIARKWYQCYLDKPPYTPYDETLCIHTQPEWVEGYGWYCRVWSDALETVFGLWIDEEVYGVDE